MWGKVAALVTAAFTALVGYTVSRGLAKKG